MRPYLCSLGICGRGGSLSVISITDLKDLYRGGAKVLLELVAACFLLSATFTPVMCERFTVGGNREWIVPNQGLNYTVWAQNVSAHVGDELYFKYNPNGHNVLKVNATAYQACNTTEHLEIWDTGDTTVSLEETGTHYFICGAPRHCALGQAFAIEVAAASSGGGANNGSSVSPNGDDKSRAVSLHVGHTWSVGFVSVVVLIFCPLLWN